MSSIVRDYGKMTIEEMYEIDLDEDNECTKTLIGFANDSLKQYDIFIDRLCNETDELKVRKYVKMLMCYDKYYKEDIDKIYELEKMKMEKLDEKKDS